MPPESVRPQDQPDPPALAAAFRMLELCACEGGVTVGLQRAGWHVTAVDVDGAALAHNPADVTVKANALAFLAEHGHEYDAAWASFPCQRWTANGANPAASKYPDLITPGRELLQATGRPWVMENVPKAPLRRDLILCGTMFDLTAVDTDGTLLHLDRHRVFESNVPLRRPADARPVSPHRCGPRQGVQWAGVYGGARKDKTEARKVRKGGYVPASAAIQSRLLGGVDWMTGKGRRECIPPVYAEWVGAQLMAEVCSSSGGRGMTDSAPDTHGLQDQPDPPALAASVRALLVEAFMAMPESYYDWPNDDDDHYYAPSVGHVADVAVEALTKAGIIR